MATIDINIKQVNNLSNDILKLSQEYNDLIQELFENLESISDKEIIIGKKEENSSTKFIRQIKKEKNIYTDYGTKLNKCASIPQELIEELKEDAYTASITFDSETINKEVKSNANKAVEFLNSAYEFNNETNVDIDTANDYINDELNGLIEDIKNFIGWTDTKILKYDEIINETNKKITEISIEDVKKRQSIVKIN